MTKILVIRSSANGARSVSNPLVDQFVADVTARNPGTTVVDRDLDADPIAHIRSDTLAGIGRPAPETEAAKPTRALSDTLIAELSTADLLVIGAPMYNFGMSTTLKSWFDHVLRAGATFNYTPQGPEGLMTGKRAVVIVSRAGAYREGAAAANDHQVPHILTLLGFIGITDVSVVCAEGLAFGPEAAAQSIANAQAELKQLASA